MGSTRRIGILGGSFNPAHEGHLHISLEAIKRLDLDEVWWTVSPQNPLKSVEELAAFATRFATAEAQGDHPRIKVCDFEAEYDLRYTVDTVTFLHAHYRNVKFVWLMGADNLASFHRWRSWRDIACRIPIAVLDRAPYGLKALHSRFAIHYAKCRIPSRKAAQLADMPAPAWVYLTIPRHPLSATYLRKTLGKNAFLRHTTRT